MDCEWLTTLRAENQRGRPGCGPAEPEVRAGRCRGPNTIKGLTTTYPLGNRLCIEVRGGAVTTAPNAGSFPTTFPPLPTQTMSPIGRYIVLVVFIIVSLVRDSDRCRPIDHDVPSLADRPPLHPFLHPPRIRSRHLNLAYQKQVHLQPPRICPRQVLHPIRLQFKQTSECPESQRDNGYVGQEQRPGQRSPEHQTDSGPVQ